MDRTAWVQLLAGGVAWLLVAVVAVYAQQQWDPFWGFFPVMAAVIVAWWSGELIVGTDDGSAEGTS